LQHEAIAAAVAPLLPLPLPLPMRRRRLHQVHTRFAAGCSASNQTLSAGNVGGLRRMGAPELVIRIAIAQSITAAAVDVLAVRELLRNARRTRTSHAVGRGR
jgi:hypothetical protein